MKKLRLTGLLLALLLLAGGCAQTLLREDIVYERLPPVDPAMGVETREQVTLYFRLREEVLLAPVYRTIDIGPRDNPARMVLEQLLAGPQEAETHVESILPAGTELLDVVRRAGLAEVTFSREFLRAGMLGSREENLRRQRLCVYAVVNSLCSLPEVESVQILVDTDGSGVGAQVPPFLLGFEEGELSAPVVGPLKRESAITATPQVVAELALQHLQEGSFQQAQGLLLGVSGSAPPEAAELEQVFTTQIRLQSYAVRGFSIKDLGRNEAKLDLVWEDAAGVSHSRQEAVVYMRADQGLQKLEYPSLLQAFQIAEETP